MVMVNAKESIFIRSNTPSIDLISPKHIENPAGPSTPSLQKTVDSLMKDAVDLINHLRQDNMKLRLQMQNIKGDNEAITSSHDILQKKNSKFEGPV